MVMLSCCQVPTRVFKMTLYGPSQPAWLVQIWGVKNPLAPLASTTIRAEACFFKRCTSFFIPRALLLNCQNTSLSQIATSNVSLLMSMPMNFCAVVVVILSSRYNTGARTSSNTVFQDLTTVRAVSETDTAIRALKRFYEPNDNRSAVSFSFYHTCSTRY